MKNLIAAETQKKEKARKAFSFFAYWGTDYSNDSMPVSGTGFV